MPDTTTPIRRRLLTAAGGLLALALVGAACGPGAEATPGAPGAETPAAPGVETPAPGAETPAAPGAETPATTPGDAAGEASVDDPCSLVSDEDASQLIGAPVTGALTELPDGSTCRFVPAEAGATGFLTVTVFQNVDADAFAEAVENFALVETGDVGDAAAAIDGTVVFQSGTNLFSIVGTGEGFQPVPQDQLLELGRSIVEDLGGENMPMAPETPGEGDEASPAPSP
jgi:hypothetical protein